MSNDDIRVRIAGDLADINRSLADLRRQTKGAGTDARGAGREYGGFGRQLDTLKKQIVGVVGAYAGFRGVQSLLRGVIRNTIEQEKALAQVEARIKSTSGAAGLAVDDLAKMAGELQNATTFGDEEILNAQALLLTFTRITRENFAEATEAALNLSTAMGTDLRSSITQIGKALNDPIAGLTSLTRSGIQFTASQRQTIRSLVETGQVVEAQRVILAELETQFGGAARAARDTLGGALDGLRNTASDLLEAQGGLPGVVGAVNELNRTLQDPAIREGLQVLIQGVLSLAQISAQGASEFASLGRQIGFNAAAIAGVVTETDRLEMELKDVERALSGTFMSRPLRFLTTSREELEQLKRDLEGMLEIARSGGRGAVQRLGQDEPPRTSTIEADVRVDLRTLQSDLQAAGRVLQDEIRRLRAGLDRELEEGLVSYAQYFRRRAELETQQISQTIEQRRNALTLLNEEIRLLESRGEDTVQQEDRRKQLIAEITVLERQRADVAGQAQRDQARAERELARELETVATRLKALQGDTVGARADELEAQFRELFIRLEAQGDETGAALVRKLINVELAKAELDKLQEEYQRTVADLARQEQALQAQVATGALSEQEARRRTVRLYQEQAERVRELIPIMRELAEASGDPAAVDRVKDLEGELVRLEKTAADTANSMKAGFKDALEDFAARSLRDVKNVKDAFRSLVDDILDQLARIAARGIINQIAGAFAGVGSAHSGGIAGQSASIRKVNPVMFIGAPRLHSGGIAGLGPGEVPAILKRGEEVLTEQDPRHRNNGGMGDFNMYVDARGSQDPSGVMAAAEALKAQAKAELYYEMRRGVRVR